MTKICFEYNYEYETVRLISRSDAGEKDVTMTYSELEEVYDKIKEARLKFKGAEGRTMRFGEAIELCRQGKYISRRDWNGKDMFVYFVKEHDIPIHDWHEPNLPTKDEQICGVVRIKGHFDMYNAQGDRIIGWVASQTDMYSDQWFVVDGYYGPDGAFHPKMKVTPKIEYEDDEDDKDDHARNQFPNRN